MGLWLVGYLPAADVGAIVPAVVFSNGLFLLISCLWAARLGRSAVAAIFGIFSAFWLSLGVILAAITNAGAEAPGVLGLTATSAALPTYLLSWLIVFAALTLATLRLPLAFTSGFLFVTIAVALVLANVLTGSAIFMTLAGICVFIFCAVFAYIWFDGMSQELGGRRWRWRWRWRWVNRSSAGRDRAGAVQFTDPDTVRRYSRWLDQLVDVALTGSEAADFCRRVAASLPE